MTLASSNMTTEGTVEVSLDEVLGILGREEYDEFESCMKIVQMILDNPNAMIGSQALIYAAKLAALRTKIGMRAQYYKTSDKSIIQRRRKDLLMAMFTALEENINTLKLLGKVEVGMINR